MAQDGDHPSQFQYRIGGAWIDGAEPGHSLDPATGEPIGTFCEADRRVARQAITAARDVDVKEQKRHATVQRRDRQSHFGQPHQS